jgi:hypothetical protein
LVNRERERPQIGEAALPAAGEDRAMSRHLIHATTIAVGIVLICATTATAGREVVRAGNLYLADNGGISPSKLPKHESAPVSARINGEIGTLDGSHPPALQTIGLDVDKTIQIDAVGLPVCRWGQIEASDTKTAERACASAIVGSGEAEVEVAFPEQPPFSAKGAVVLFNGGVKGDTTLVFVHAYVAVPTPTAVIVAAKITRIHHGRFGLHIAARIPRIAGGSASVTKFQLKVGRAFSYKGKRKSFLTASCPTGHYVTDGEVLFSDGTELGVNHVFPCTSKG